MNWLSYKESLSKLSNKQKGDSFERLTQYYLKYEPQYATKLKEVWLLSEVPLKIHKKLNLPIQDQGIDLICETKDGEYWAVQSKYHEDEATNQTFKSLATFGTLAFTVCNNISFGLVCTTAERFTKTLKNQESIGFCTSEVWRELDEDFFRKFSTNRKPKKVKAYKPFPHQKRAIKNAHDHFIKDKESRGKMIMPCGAGKSLTAFWIAEKLDAKRIIVAVPSLNLIRQTLRSWLRESSAKSWNVDWITVCSDPSVGDINSDDQVIFKQDLGVPAITDPKVIAQFLRKKHSGKVVVFTTYQSGKTLAKASRIAKINFDLGVMDEAHKMVGSSEKSFAHLLFDKNIKIKKRVFMTATERRYRGTQENFLSMDDYESFGRTFDMLSFKEALNQKPPILSDYKIVTFMVSDKEISKLVKSGKFIKPSGVKWTTQVQADTFASLVALRKAIKKYNIKHSISFHSSIAKAKNFRLNQEIFSSVFTNYGSLDNFHVSGNMPTSKRASTLKDFESSKKALITNARCLTEGVDIPAIDCVLFADPKKSTVDIVQAVGRALRLHKGKKFGYVVVPVVIDKEGEGFEESKAFQSIMMVLRALASNDERIVEYFKDRANKKRPKKIINIEIDTQLAKKIDEKKFVEELELKAWDKLARLSWMPFHEARDYVQSLNFKGSGDWKKYYHQKVPKDIPVTPDRIYPEWINWGDWFGTGYLATQDRKYWPFKKLRDKSRKLNLTNGDDWRKFTKNNPSFPVNEVPRAPEMVYKNNGWISWGNFLGNRKKEKFEDWMDYEKARIFIRSLKLKSSEEWRKYCKGELKGYNKKPFNIPVACSRIYKNNGWINWADFLGTDHIRKQNILSYVKAKAKVKKYKLHSRSDWVNYNAMNQISIDLPSDPQAYYKDSGWVSWGDYLSSNFIADSEKSFLKYDKAKVFVKKLDLKSQKEWFLYTKNKIKNKPKFPDNIPKGVEGYYKNSGWVSWGDFLGTGNVHKIKYMPYKDAQKFASSLKLKSRSEWVKYCNGEIKGKPVKPIEIPNTEGSYINTGEWKGWDHFLGKTINYWSFTKSRNFVRALKIITVSEWHHYRLGKSKKYGIKPKEIPSVPQSFYKDKGWISYQDWLNINYIAPTNRSYRSFKKSKKYVHKLKIDSYSKWREWSNDGNKPDDVPFSPGKVYKEEWKGWGDFLGTNRISERDKIYLPYEKAKKLVQTFNITSRKHWRKFTKEADQKIFNTLPKTIPLVYGKDKKWKGEKEFFNWPDKKTTLVMVRQKRLFQRLELRHIRNGLNIVEVISIKILKSLKTFQVPMLIHIIKKLESGYPGPIYLAMNRSRRRKHQNELKKE